MPGPLQRVLRRRGDEPDEHPTAVEPVAGEQPTTEQPATTEPATTPTEPEPSWRDRGRLRRRLRFLRRARELALRDLGGLVFDLHRFGRERPDLVKAKLEALATLDQERRQLEVALGDHRELDVLREPGIASCPRCGALHGSDARFCSACGLPVGQSAALPPAPAADPNEPTGEPATPEPVPGAAAATTDAPAT